MDSEQAQVRITRTSDTEAQVIIELSADQLKELQEEAKKRDLSLADTFGEGIRLQRLMNRVKASGGKEALYLRTDDKTQELESV